MLHAGGLQGCKSSILIYCDNAGKAKSAQLSDSIVIKLVSETLLTAWTPTRPYEMGSRPKSGI